jgi:hypothetical protein
MNSRESFAKWNLVIILSYKFYRMILFIHRSLIKITGVQPVGATPESFIFRICAAMRCLASVGPRLPLRTGNGLLQRRISLQRQHFQYAIRKTPVRADGSGTGGGEGTLDDFGGLSAERKAAEILRTFHTIVAARCSASGLVVPSNVR